MGFLREYYKLFRNIIEIFIIISNIKKVNINPKLPPTKAATD